MGRCDDGLEHLPIRKWIALLKEVFYNTSYTVNPVMGCPVSSGGREGYGKVCDYLHNLSPVKSCPPAREYFDVMRRLLEP